MVHEEEFLLLSHLLFQSVQILHTFSLYFSVHIEGRIHFVEVLITYINLYLYEKLKINHGITFQGCCSDYSNLMCKWIYY